MASLAGCFDKLYAFDEQFRAAAPGMLICGVDEAGRGPLCGPVAAGAVILDMTNPIKGLNDSKRLSEKAREALYPEIIEKSIAWHVELVSPEEIDRLNILWATMKGMADAVSALHPAPDFVLIDGNRCPELPFPSQFVIKGDSISASIAAASVLAKVTRDRFMYALHEKYPQYSLAQHKGYPTKLHYELLQQHGVQDFYRKSFLKKRGI